MQINRKRNLHITWNYCPIIGISKFAQAACKGIGINRNSYNKILPFTFISQAIIETPILLSLIISILLGALNVKSDLPEIMSIVFLAVGFGMGSGTLGAGIASGRTATAACYQIAINPKSYPTISKASMLAQGIIDNFGYLCVCCQLNSSNNKFINNRE